MEEQIENKKSEEKKRTKTDIASDLIVIVLVILIVTVTAIQCIDNYNQIDERTVIATVYPEQVTENMLGMKNYSITFVYEEINDKTQEQIYAIYTSYGRENYYKYKDCKELTMTLVIHPSQYGNRYILKM